MPGSLSPIAHNLSGDGGVRQSVSGHELGKISLNDGTALQRLALTSLGESRLSPLLPNPAESSCWHCGAQRGQDSQELPPASPQRQGIDSTHQDGAKALRDCRSGFFKLYTGF